jgi:hypothetical protein
MDWSKRVKHQWHLMIIPRIELSMKASSTQNTKEIASKH